MFFFLNIVHELFLIGIFQGVSCFLRYLFWSVVASTHVVSFTTYIMALLGASPKKRIVILFLDQWKSETSKIKTSKIPY